MTYYGSKELAGSFRTVRNNTIQIAEDILEEQYGYRVAPECRSVGETLVHIGLTVQLQEQIQFVERRTSLAGFDFFAFVGKMIAEEKASRSKSQIVEFLRVEGEKFAQAVEASSEEFLAESVEYPQGMTPPSKSRFEMLLGVKEHEMHHRGQLMAVQRILGIKPHLTRRMEERMAAMKSAQTAG